MRGFVFLGVCCLFHIGAGLSRVRMPPWVIACSSKRGAPTVFKCVWYVLDSTLDKPGHGNGDPLLAPTVPPYRTVRVVAVVAILRVCAAKVARNRAGLARGPKRCAP